MKNRRIRTFCSLLVALMLTGGSLAYPQSILEAMGKKKKPEQTTRTHAPAKKKTSDRPKKESDPFEKYVWVGEYRSKEWMMDSVAGFDYSKREEVAIAQDINGNYGLIDKRGKAMGNFVYGDIEFLEEASNFSYQTNIYKAKKNGYYGLIDSNAKPYTGFEYSEIRDSHYGIIAKKDGYYGMLDKNGKTYTGFVYSEVKNSPSDCGGLIAKKDGHYGIIDEYGYTRLPFVYDEIEVITFYNDFYGVFRVKKNGKYGIISFREFKEIFPCKYSSITYETDKTGLQKVTVDGKTGYYDGEREIVPLYDKVSPLLLTYTNDRNNYHQRLYAWVKNGNNIGIYGNYDSQAGKEVLPCRFTEVLNLKDGSLAVDSKLSTAPPEDPVALRVSNGYLWGIYRTDGREISPCQWEQMSNVYTTDGKDYIWVTAGGKYGVMRPDGTMVLPCDIETVAFNQENYEAAYQKGKGLPPAITQYAYIVRNGKFGVIDKHCNIVVPTEYDDVGRYSGSRFLVKKDGLFGYTDQNGELVITPQFTYATDFSEGKAAVRKSGEDKKYYFINANGYELFSVKADEVGLFKNGLCPVHKGDKYYYIDVKGKKVKENNRSSSQSDDDGWADL